MRLAALFTLLLLPALLFARQPADSQPVDVDALLPGPREEFRVGFAELQTASLPPERRFIAATFPRLLYEELRTSKSRLLSRVELNAYLSQRIADARESAGRRLTAAVDARDLLLFRPEVTAEQRERAQHEVLQARAEFQALEDANISATEGQERPVAFLSEVESGRLLPPIQFAQGRVPVSSAVHATAEESDLDYLIFGLAEEQAGYTIVDIYGYHRFLESVELLTRTTRLSEEVGEDAPAVADEMASLLLGREWATLLVVSERPDAAIRVNGELVGFGRAEVRYAKPGEYSVSARVAGFERVTEQIALSSGERTVVTLEFLRSEGQRTTLRSSPTGADVYVDSLWVGRTPLVYPFPSGSSVVHIRSAGYLESRFMVDAESPPVISRALLTEQIDWTVELREQRDEFYRALGYFVLSVPVTVLLWGGYQNVLGTRASPDLSLLPPQEDARLVQLGNTFYWSALGGFAVNTGLFINMIINLLDYVAVGEGAHNQ